MLLDSSPSRMAGRYGGWLWALSDVAARLLGGLVHVEPETVKVDDVVELARHTSSAHQLWRGEVRSVNWDIEKNRLLR